MAIVVRFDGGKWFLLPSFTPKPSIHSSCLAWACSLKVLQNSCKWGLDMCECKENACLLEKLVFHGHCGVIWWWEVVFVAIIHTQAFYSQQLSCMGLEPQGVAKFIEKGPWYVWVQRKCLSIVKTSFPWPLWCDLMVGSGFCCHHSHPSLLFTAAVLHRRAASRCCKVHANGALICVSAKKMPVYCKS